MTLKDIQVLFFYEVAETLKHRRAILKRFYTPLVRDSPAKYFAFDGSSVLEPTPALKTQPEPTAPENSMAADYGGFREFSLPDMIGTT